MTHNPRAPRDRVVFGKRSPLDAHEDAREADLVATWAARVGALALLVGAGFGYRYAVDRGLIGPGGRVALGVLAALALIVASEWTAGRGWRAFAQAAAGAGTSLLYVTTWAAFHQYGLVDANVAFVLLAATACAGVVLALRHDSEALAVLAIVGAFGNPIVVGSGSVGTMAVFGYVLVVDLSVLALANFRNWEILDWVVATASWCLFLFVHGPVVRQPEAAIAFVSTYHVIFAATAVLKAIQKRGGSERPAAFLAVNGMIYVGALMALVTPQHPEWRGAALGIVGVGYLALSLALWRGNVRGALTATSAAIGTFLVVVCVPVQFELQWVPALLAAEGAAAVVVGYLVRSPSARLLGSALMLGSVATAIVTLADGTPYEPARLFISMSSLAYVVHATALFVGAAALLRRGEGDERQAGTVLLVVANALTLVYVSLEASAYVNRTFDVPSRYQAVQFAYTIIASLHACLLVTVGVFRNSRLFRYLGIMLFGGTLIKLVASDVWLLGTGYRTLVFVGVGVLLLGCSLLYSRFRELLQEWAPEAPRTVDGPSS
jgi:uncharacterized membrane protein